MPLLLDPRTDAFLVRKALAGRTNCLEALVLRYQRKAYAVARAVSLDPDRADDVVQEAFLLALQNLTSLRVHASFGPWFLQIVRNVARKTHRREPLEFSGEAEPRPVEALDTAEVKEFRDSIWNEVRRLPDAVREAIFLYYHEGRSVREVARALGISSAAARKRLQYGRELLSERLWRTLENTLRDLLPSAREWKRQGRRIALVAIASLSARRTLEASSGVSGLATMAGGSPSFTLLASLGGFVMANKAIVSSAAAVILLSGGIFLWTNGEDEPVSEERPVASSGSASPDRSIETELAARLERSEAELQRLQAENLRLAAEVDRSREPPSEADPASALHAGEAASGIDWTTLSGLIAENVDLLGTIRKDAAQPEFSAGDQAKLMSLMSEFMKINAAARERSERPFFDPVVFDELTLALFKDSIGLSEEQARELSRSGRRLLEEMLGEENPADLAPRDRYRLRKEISQHLRGALEDMLSEEQFAKWDALRDFSDAVFEGSVRTHEFGLDATKLPDEVTKTWKKTFQLRPNQVEPAQKLAASYVETARETLRRYGEDQETIRSLSADDRVRLENEFFELQTRYELELERLLDDEQLDAYMEADPLIIRFRFGSGASSGHKSGLF